MKDVVALFPFGHGLSYTTFAYSNLTLPNHVEMGESLHVSLDVKNTGNCAGKEVVQLYIHDVKSTLIRPVKELKGFSKVALAPGESKTVTFTLSQRDLSFYDPHQKQWIAEAGDFDILIGPSSQNIVLSQRFTLS
jgi:beta-glucosidase